MENKEELGNTEAVPDSCCKLPLNLWGQDQVKDW